MSRIRRFVITGTALSAFVLSPLAIAQAPAATAPAPATAKAAAPTTGTASATAAAAAAALSGPAAASAAVAATAKAPALASVVAAAAGGSKNNGRPGMFTLAGIQHIGQISGGVIYALLVILLIELIVIVDRVWYLSATLRRGGALMKSLAAIKSINDPNKLKPLVESGRGPSYEVLKNFIESANNPGTTAREIDDYLDESILEQQPGLNKRIWILDTIITLGPLLGLLGTIIGMFDTFSVLGNIQSGGATSQVSGGIAVALVATGIGIFIACLGLIFFNPINNRIRTVMHQMETVKTILMNRLRIGRRGSGDGASEDFAHSADHARDFEDSSEHLF